MVFDNKLFNEFLDSASPAQLLEKAQELSEKIWKDIIKHANPVINLGSAYATSFEEYMVWLRREILDPYKDYFKGTEVDGQIRVYIDFEEFREKQIKEFVEKIKDGFDHMRVTYYIYINNMWREEEESTEENEQ